MHRYESHISISILRESLLSNANIREFYVKIHFRPFISPTLPYGKKHIYEND